MLRCFHSLLSKAVVFTFFGVTNRFRYLGGGAFILHTSARARERCARTEAHGGAPASVQISSGKTWSSNLPIPLQPMISPVYTLFYTHSLKKQGALSLEMLCQEPNLETICRAEGQ